MVDKKLSEFSAVNASDVSDIVVLFLDGNNAKKNGRLAFSTFVSTLALLAGNNIFTGDNTFSGDVVFSGNTTFNNEINAVALKAKQDASGNVITETYATKTELQQKASFKLFYSDWFDSTMNDEDWLLANNFSWHPGGTYSNAYNHLVADIDGISPSTETIGSYTITYYQATDGHKICLPDQETNVQNIYNESGVAWYYILDTANQRFKLPRENPAREELIQVIRAKGNGIALGLTNGTLTAGLHTINAGNTGTLIGNPNQYGQDVGHSDLSNSYLDFNKAVGITTDSTKSGIISDMTESTSVYKGKKYLYFYVGQFSQSATEQTAGLNASLFNGKMDLDMSNMNPSPIAKETIVGFGMPKYNAMISITSGYSVQTKGFVFVSMNGTSHVTNSISINGTEIAMSQAANQYQEAPVMVQIPVDVGDIITWSGTSSVIALYCPMKGV